MAKLYLITTKQGCYVGKWSTNNYKYMTDHHMDNIYPWISFGQKYGWEASFWKPDINSNGFKQGIHFIDNIQEQDMNKLLQDFRSFLKSNPIYMTTDGKDLFEVLRYCWGVGDLEILEALCILSCASHKVKLLNTQIDFLGHKLNLNDANILQSLISSSAFERRLKEYRWNAFDYTLFRRINAKDFTKFFSFKTNDPNSLPGVIKELFQAFFVDNKKYQLMRIESSAKDEDKLWRYFRYKVSDKVIQDFQKDMNNYKKKLRSQGEVGKTIVDFIDNNILSQLDNYRGKYAKTLYEFIYEQMQHLRDSYMATLDTQHDNEYINAAVTMIAQVIEQYNFYDKLSAMPSVKKTIFPEMERKFKKELTKKCLNIFDSFLEYNRDYSEFQHKYVQPTQTGVGVVRKKGLPVNHYGEGFAGKMFSGTPSEYSIQDRFAEKILDWGAEFYLQSALYTGVSRKSLYGEQIAIWLKTRGQDDFYVTAIPKFQWQETAIKNTDGTTITIY